MGTRRSAVGVIKNLGRKALLMSPLRHYAYYRYQYGFTPAQLCFLCSVISDVRDVPGVCLEIGCAYGATTVFLNKHLEGEKIDKRYIAIDTFQGFTSGDIAFEVEQRNKTAGMFKHAFQLNSKTRFDGTMPFNVVRGVQSYAADVGEFDFAEIGTMAFCLLDVDLYRPTANALPRIYQELSPGGVIVIDDCQEHDRWDGALAAYKEFCETNELPIRIVHGKLGVIKKANQDAGGGG